MIKSRVRIEKENNKESFEEFRKRFWEVLDNDLEAQSYLKELEEKDNGEK